MYLAQLKHDCNQPAGRQTVRTQVQQRHETAANKCKESRQKQLKVILSQTIASPSSPKR